MSSRVIDDPKAIHEEIEWRERRRGQLLRELRVMTSEIESLRDRQRLVDMTPEQRRREFRVVTS